MEIEPTKRQIENQLLVFTGLERQEKRLYLIKCKPGIILPINDCPAVANGQFFELMFKTSEYFTEGSLDTLTFLYSLPISTQGLYLHLRLETKLSDPEIMKKYNFSYKSLPDLEYLLKIVFLETAGDIHKIIKREFSTSAIKTIVPFDITQNTISTFKVQRPMAFLTIEEKSMLKMFDAYSKLFNLFNTKIINAIRNVQTKYSELSAADKTSLQKSKLMLYQNFSNTLQLLKDMSKITIDSDALVMFSAKRS